MMKPDALGKLFICPLCCCGLNIKIHKADEFGIEEGEIICQNCHRQYPIKRRMIDLRTGLRNPESDDSQWELESFKKGYAKIGYYKNGLSWAQAAKYPPIAEEFRYPKVKGRISEWLHPKNGQIILDVGCGVGWFIFEIMKMYPEVNFSFFGLDPVRSNIYWLNYRSQEEKKTNLIGILGEAESLPFAKESFDIIMTSEALEHIFDKEKALKQMHRVLKTGGQLFISTPARPVVEFWNSFFWLPQQAKRLFRPKRTSSDEKAPYDEPLSQGQLKRYLQQTGFTIEEFQQSALMPHESYFQFFPYWLSWSIIKIASFLESHLKPLVSRAGLHYVVKTKK